VRQNEPDKTSEKSPQYPIGKFSLPESISPEDRRRYIEAIASAPAKLVIKPYDDAV